MMKNTGCRLLLPSLIGILSLAFASNAFAVTPPALNIADGAGNIITVDDTGTVTYGGICTPTTCTTNFIVIPQPGQIDWSGTIGSFSLSLIVGITKPVSEPNPSQDFNIQHITSTTGGTLTLQWTDINFNGNNITAATQAAGRTEIC